MKKFILVTSTLFMGSFGLTAQSSLLVTETAHGATITNGQVIYMTVGAGAINQIDLNLKNISTTTKTYKMKMSYDLRHVVSATDQANPYFCFAGTCYPPNTFVSPGSLTLTATQDALAAGFPTSVHYDEASAVGPSIIRYRIYEINTPNDTMGFTVRYNDPTASIKTNSSLLSNVSDVFPNPSSSKAFINVTALVDVNAASISVINALGSIVLSKTIELSIGKNTIDLDFQSLISGLYFVTISNNNYKITKKFTINK